MKRTVILFGFVALLSAGPQAARAGDDTRPGLKSRWAAWQAYAKTYKASKLFPLLRYPRGSDWLARHHERGRTYEDYIQSKPVRLTRTRDRIVIQPVGTFTPAQGKLLSAMREHLGIYFQCRVDLLEAVPLPKKGFRQRTTGPQYRCDAILKGILLPKLPDNAASYMGVTCADIYPDEKWNFVFGQAYLHLRVGVQSLARYYPSFWGARPAENEETLVLRRALKTMTHETAHTFSMWHCTYFQCNVNGSNSLPESDRRHIHLCPVCLKKLQWNRGFDVGKRYRELFAFYTKHKLVPEADWVKKRLAELGEP